MRRFDVAASTLCMSVEPKIFADHLQNSDTSALAIRFHTNSVRHYSGHLNMEGSDALPIHIAPTASNMGELDVRHEDETRHRDGTERVPRAQQRRTARKRTCPPQDSYHHPTSPHFPPSSVFSGSSRHAILIMCLFLWGMISCADGLARYPAPFLRRGICPLPLRSPIRLLPAAPLSRLCVITCRSASISISRVRADVLCLHQPSTPTAVAFC